MEGQRDGSILLFGAILFWFVSLLILVGASLLVWALKDGLGPDSVESHGLLALSRFWQGMRSILILYVVPTFTAGCLLYRCDSRRWANRMQGNIQSDSASVTPEL